MRLGAAPFNVLPPCRLPPLLARRLPLLPPAECPPARLPYQSLPPAAFKNAKILTLGEAGVALEEVSKRLTQRDPDWQPNAMMLKVQPQALGAPVVCGGKVVMRCARCPCARRSRQALVPPCPGMQAVEYAQRFAANKNRDTLQKIRE